MPNINLIAARRAEKKRLEKLTRNLFFGFAASFGALIVTSSYLGLQQMAMQSDLAAADQALVRLKPKKDRVAAIEADMAVLEPKVETLGQAKRDTLRWPALMQAISQSVPDNTWLSGVNASGGGDAPITLRVAGFSSSQTQAADTVLLLQKQPIFSDVSLSFTGTAPSPNDSQPRTTFEASATLKGSGKSAEDGASEGGGTINAEKRQQAVDKVSRTERNTGVGISGEVRNG